MTKWEMSIFSIFALPIFIESASGLEPYKVENNTGIQSFVTRYFVHEGWHLRATEGTTGRSKGSKWFELETTNGKQYPRTGIYQTGSVEPSIEIWVEPGNSKRLSIKPGNTPLGGSVGILTVNGKTFETEFGKRPATQDWRGEIAKNALREMLSADQMSYSYIDAGRTQRWPAKRSQ